MTKLIIVYDQFLSLLYENQMQIIDALIHTLRITLVLYDSTLCLRKSVPSLLQKVHLYIQVDIDMHATLLRL